MPSIKIEILKENSAPTSRARRDDASQLSWTQPAYAHLGGVFPVEIKLPLENASHAYSVGVYELDASSFKVNQYGSLELDRWNIALNATNQQAKVA